MEAYRTIQKTRDLVELFDLPEEIGQYEELEVIILPPRGAELVENNDKILLGKIMQQDSGLLERLTE